MIFTGLPLSTLMTLAGVVGGLTVVFYILKLRRRPVAVPFSRIWQRVLRDKEATTWFSRLKRLLSLLLQLAMVATLLMALGDPRLSGRIVEGRNIVVLVDGSASMKATDVEPDRIGVARAEVREMVRGLSGSDRMLVAQMGAAVRPLTPMTGEVADLELAVDQLEAVDTRADFVRGLRFAVDSLTDLSKPEVVVISDGAFGDLEGALDAAELGDVKLTYVPVGDSGKNVAITGFSVRRYPLDKSRYEVMLEVTNTNDERARTELTLLGDGEIVDITTLELGPGEVLPRFYKDLAGASRTLEAKIRRSDGVADDLPADDHAYALMPERRRSRVLVVTPGNTYIEAALLLDEYLDVTFVKPSDYPPAESFDVTIFDGVAPQPAKNHGSLLYLDPPDEGAPVPVGRKFDGFAFDTWDRKHPIVRWMALENVQVIEGKTLKIDEKKGDRVIGASNKGPTLVAGRRGGRRFVVLGFDPRRSDFVLRVAWPLFVLNTINTFVEEDTSYLSSYRTGDVWRVPVPGDATSAELRAPDGSRRTIPVKDGRAVYLGERAGFYELTTSSEADAPTTMFAANLIDPDESEIEPVKELAIAGRKAGALDGFEAGVRRELWLYLLLAVVIVSCLEWVTYHRRITV